MTNTVGFGFFCAGESVDRDRVRCACSQEVERNGWNANNYLYLDVEFLFSRPESHYCKSGLLSKKAPIYPKRKIGKLLRAVCDALTSVAYLDDSQVVSIKAAKSYVLKGQPPGVTITIKQAL